MPDASKPDVESTSHISSIVVHVHPAALTQVKASIANMHETEVHSASPDGKLVVTMETDSLHLVTERVDDINKMPGVVNALLVYHQVEDTARLDDEIDQAVPMDDQTLEGTS